VTELEYSVTIGTFDGIHKGHKYILSRTKKIAKEMKLNPLAILLKYPIKRYFNSFDGLIYPSWVRKEMIEKMGFNVEIIEMENVWGIDREEYIKMLLKKGMKSLTCGEDFRLGRGAKGDVIFLNFESQKLGFHLNVLHDLKEKDSRVSSSSIRHLLKNGELETANKFLEKNWTLEGPVYKDRKVGADLGFPTANINISFKEEVIYPKYGVYLVKMAYKGKTIWGLMNVGVRPTYYEDKKAPKVEVYFLDFNENLYEKYIKIEILKFLRPEIRFSSEQDLINAMKKDEENARQIIKTTPL
jgi:riboflavin kinase/FMN adenylyltransferase